MEAQGSKDPQDSQGYLDQMVFFLDLKEQQEQWATQALLGSLGLVDRKDGKVMPGTVDVREISSSGVFQGCQDPRASPVPMENQGRKGIKATRASTVSLVSQGSRESLVILDLLGPKE